MGLWPNSLHTPCLLGSSGSEPEYPASGGGIQLEPEYPASGGGIQLEPEYPASGGDIQLEIHCMSKLYYKWGHRSILILETKDVESAMIIPFVW